MSKRPFSKQISSHYKAAEAYANSFDKDGYLSKHLRKFSQRIDMLRDKIELEIIDSYAKGNLFDCSIGFGRFVERLSQVSTYDGMDISRKHLEYVKNNYPQVKLCHGNLLEGIEQPDNRFDTVMCIRTLNVLPDLLFILKEMCRITKPNGLIIITYGPKACDASFDGHSYKSNIYNLDDIFQKINVKTIKIVYKDQLLTFIKRNRLSNKMFRSRYNIVPDIVFKKIDLILSSICRSADSLIVAQKMS